MWGWFWGMDKATILTTAVWQNIKVLVGVLLELIPMFGSNKNKLW